MNDIIPNTIAILTATPTRWFDLVRVTPTNLLRLPPSPGEWSSVDCLKHLIDTEKFVFPVRIGYFRTGQDFPAFNPDAGGSMTLPLMEPVNLATEFSRLRQDSLALLRSLSPTDLARKARHAELGAVTLAEMLHEWAAHDLMHTVQAEQALMQPFIRGSGPWKVYFQKHTII